MSIKSTSFGEGKGKREKPITSLSNFGNSTTKKICRTHVIKTQVRLLFYQYIFYEQNMNQAIYIKHLWQTKDLVQAYKDHKKSSKYFWLSRLLVFGLGIFNLLFGLFGLFSELSNGFALFQVVIGLLLLMGELISNLVYKYRCKRLDYDNRQVEWEIREDRIVHRMINLTESTFSWELIKGILNTPQGFLLYPQKNLFYFIPKSGFQQQEDIAHFVFIAQDKVKSFQQISN